MATPQAISNDDDKQTKNGDSHTIKNKTIENLNLGATHAFRFLTLTKINKREMVYIYAFSSTNKKFLKMTLEKLFI